MKIEDGTYFVNGDRLDSSTMTKGYWVAESDHSIDHLTTGEEILSFARWIESRYEVAHVGIWTNDKGRTVLDATHHVFDLLAAISLGRHWDQKAIWDIEHGHAIYI